MSQVELAQRVIEKYAEGLDGLSDDDCKALVKEGSGGDHIEADQCQVLQDVLRSEMGELDQELYVKSAYIDHREIQGLVRSEFSSDFIDVLVGSDGKKALRARVKWIGEYCVKDYDISAKEREAAIRQLLNRLFVGDAEDARGALPGLRKAAVSDPHEKVRIAACEAFGYIDAEGEETISVLIAALEDPHPRVQEAAADALGDADEGYAKKAVPSLIRALKKGDAGVREAAADALGSIGPDAKEAAPALSSIFLDQNEADDMRKSAAIALISIDLSKASNLFVRVLKKEGEEGRHIISAVVDDIGPGGEEFYRPFIMLLGRQDEGLRRTAFKVIADSCHYGIYDIMGMMGDDDSALRRDVVMILGASGNRDAIPVLEAALNDDDVSVQKAAEAALKRVR